MTHDTTSNHDDLTETFSANDDPQPGSVPIPDTDSTVPFTPLNAIPIPKPNSVLADPSSMPDQPDKEASDSGTGRDTHATEPGTATWFSKLRIHRNEPGADHQSPASGSTNEAPPRFSEPDTTGASAPDFEARNDAPERTFTPSSASLPARRIVVVKRHANRNALHSAAAFIGAPAETLTPRPYRILIASGAILILLALLVNNAGLALTVFSALVPLVLLLTIAGNRGTLLSDSTIVLAITGLGGVIVGGVLGWIAARIGASNWFDEGVLNYGAAGFGGHYAHAAGNAGWLVWLVNGLVLPVVALAAALAIPIALHRSSRFLEATGNGLVLGAAAGAGYAIGTAAVFWSPLSIHDAPAFPVSDWTLMTIGIAVLQPIVAVLALAALGAAAWRYLSDQQIAPAILPAVCGVGGVLLLRLGSIWIQPRQEHLWLELVWTILVTAGVIVLYHVSVVQPLGHKRTS
ncbi:MAG: hypothetical protein QM753_15500 [Thermomicrobiales bacterium]